jgi:hypothetical protein
VLPVAEEVNVADVLVDDGECFAKRKHAPD